MDEIKTAEEAEHIGYMWAVSRGMDAVLFAALAKSIFQDRVGICTVPMVETSIQHFANAAGRELTMWAELSARTWNLQSQWSIETAKHLAIVSVAGIAGTAALLQKGSATADLSVSLVFFTFGILAALLQFWLTQKGYAKRAIDFDSRAGTIRGAKTWDDYVAVPRWTVDAGRRWFAASQAAGWLSAICSIIGVAMLGKAIWVY